MTAVSFEDPNLPSTATFEANGVSVTAPVFETGELQQVLACTQQNARTYYEVDHTAARSLNRTFELWTQPDYALRQTALPLLSNLTGFSAENILCFGLAPLKAIRFETEALQEFPRQLRGLVESGRYRDFTPWGSGRLKGYGEARLSDHSRPERIFQILAGNVVGPTWITACLGAASQSAQVIKLPHQDMASFLFFLQTLAEIDPSFRSTIACGYFSSADQAHDYFLKTSDVVVAMGSDDTMQAIQRDLARLNPQARFIPHGLKISFQVISREYATPEVAELAAWGIVAYDGNGCFSPANLYVEKGGPLDPQQFAQALAEAMQALAEKIPPKRTLGTAEKVSKYRNSQIQRRLLGENVRVLKSANTDYTVIVDYDDPTLKPTCQERVVIVKPVDDIQDVPNHVAHLSGNLQTVGLALPSQELTEYADQLGRAGVTNFKALGTEYTIDINDPHDGIFDIVQMYWSDALRWTCLAFTDTDQALDAARQLKADSLALLSELETKPG
jgi:hypothetical protein